MHALPLRKFALSPPGSCRGVSCDTDGAFIHGIPLLKCEWKNGETFSSARNIDDISDQLSLRLNLPIDVSPKSAALGAIARHLNNGDLVHAQLVALHLQFPDLSLANAASQSERISFVRELHLSGVLRKVWDPDEHPRWPAGSPESQGGQFAPEDADFGFVPSPLDSDSAETEIAAGTSRIHPRALRRPWEKAEGKVWPKDPKTRRNMDAAHVRALADGGDNSPTNIKPMPHDEHVAEHKARGDFSRWANRKASSRQTSSTRDTSAKSPTDESRVQAKPSPEPSSTVNEDTDPMLDNVPLDEIPIDELPIIIPE